MVRFAKRSCTGTKRMVSAKKRSSSRSLSVRGKRVSVPSRATVSSSRSKSKPSIGSSERFAVCVRNDGYRASLELRKLYSVLQDDFADEHGMIRVVDESGEDYLYPSAYFVRVALPHSVEQALAKIA